ncbi:16S rRNA (uracil(1498)-N(3))-methyltransferase [[Eubacterium] hominis]|uniref:16S rRNA (uracil(1498)-N(3))-methyltransferase n=1 Tax=[Eubacterium] hominis TaxID=2764325 RepID=UPI003A4D95B3
MQQYFIDTMAHIHDEIILNEEQSHHITHVLRMRNDDVIRIADASEQMFFSHIRIEGKKVIACIDESIEDHTKSKIHLTLAQGLIKKEKWDFLLQKSAELGVDRIVPFISSRTIVKSKDEKAEKKKQRYEKILLEACEQCKRSTLVELSDVMAYQDLIHVQADLKLIAYEDADQTSEYLKDILKQHPSITSVMVVIGSEGGFSIEEVSYLKLHGFQRVSLGARILRAETAALSTLANLTFFYEGEV